MKRTVFQPARLIALLVLSACVPTVGHAGALEDALARFEAAHPRSVEALAPADTSPVDGKPPVRAAGRANAAAVDDAAADLIRAVQDPRPEVILPQVERLLSAKARVDAGLAELFALRTSFSALPADDCRRTTICNYLQTISRSIDLAGRLRYLEFDVCNDSARQLANQPGPRQKLVELFLKYRSSVGAIAMSDVLDDPEPGSASYGRPVSPVLRAKVLDLIAATGETECLPALAEFVVRPGLPAALVIQGAETVRSIGLPQTVRPGQDPSLPAPPITAAQLHAVITRLNLRGAPAEMEKRRGELAAWLETRKRVGLDQPSYRWGGADLQPGDWLLMRNPSPYNLFTDLSPGLFTHVGVVALERGSDGIGRMVLVDLPERGNRMPATNIDTFLARSRHFLFLRHPDAEVGRKMGETAASLIGNETEFDLTFRTDRVLELVGQPLAGKKITTYCAGLLLLCGSREWQASR